MPRRKRSSQENQSRSSLSINKDKPQQRYAANARERARMRVLSRAFCRLKTTLPWVPADTKLSKLDTLRLAASYIAHLKGILRDETLGSSESSLHPAMSMTWPFGFNRPLGGSAGGGSNEGGSILDSDVDDDDVLDDDDDDGESISSCTWEEVSPSSTAKDCVHLDTTPRKSSTRRGAKARGKGNSTNNNNRVNVVTRADAQVHRKEEAPTYNLSKQSLTNNNVTIRPLSQNLQQQQEDHRHFQHEHHNFHTGNTIALQHHHHQNIQEVLKPNDSPTLNTMMAATNLENAPPPPLLPSLESSHQHPTELFVGVGNNESFLTDMNNGSYSTGTAESMHHLNHHQQHNNNDVHHHLPFAYGNTDLISIG